jgi:hypothetical protein
MAGSYGPIGNSRRFGRWIAGYASGGILADPSQIRVSGRVRLALPSTGRPPPPVFPRRAFVSSAPTAKFFVNQGLVSSRTDMQNLLRPLLKQTVSYRYQRGRELIAHGTGWVERIVVDDPETSTYFTPISISLNVDSFEHLEFDTRPDQLLVYTLVQGDERVVIEYAPLTTDAEGAPVRGAQQLEFDTSGFVQMELQGLGDDPQPARSEPDPEA